MIVIECWGGHHEEIRETDVMYPLLATHHKNTPPILVERGDGMKHIVFEYKDRYTDGEWRKQECTMSSIDQCIKVYGLGQDCDYRIVSVKDVDG